MNMILKDITLREKCSNTEFFPVRFFSHSDWILRISPYSVCMRENTDQRNFVTEELLQSE